MKYLRIIKKNTLLICLLMLTSVVFAQKSSKTVSELKTKEILEKASNQSDPKNLSLATKSLELKYESKTRITNTENMSFDDSNEIRIAVEFPKRVYYEIYSDYTSNQQIRTQVLNENKYSEDSQMFVNGKPFNFRSNSDALRAKTTKEEQIKAFKKSIFTKLFPIFFRFELYDAVDLRYVGDGEVNGIKANIIEAKENGKTIFQLFFDKERGLPIYMTETYFDSLAKKERERKTYYLDYRKEGGILIAHKVIIQIGKSYTEEIVLKKLQINPKFKTNLFEVKEK